MKTKYIVGVTLFLFWAAVTALATTSLLLYEKNKGGTVDQILTATSTTTGTKNILTTTEVAKHNTTASCWIVVSGKVYDVTSLIGTHSGGSNAITQACGRDATNDFLTKNGNGSHTRSDAQMLGSYYIGDVGSSASTIQNTVTKNNASNGIISSNNSGVNTNQISTVTLTVSEVAKHNTTASCWMTISGKVYDITNFFGSHPGGDPALRSSCGTDATVAFNTRGGTGTHSQSAIAMLTQFYIGNSGATITTSNTTSNGQPVVTPPAFTGGGRGEDDD
jgi:cytochrome b involved in lipid metabolism